MGGRELRQGSLCALGAVNHPALAWVRKVAISLSIDVCMAEIVVCTLSC
jgi:hypothetical protein